MDRLINSYTLLHRKNSSITHERRTCSFRRNENVSSCQKGMLQFSSSQRASYVISFPTSPLTTLFHEPQRDVFTAFVALPLCRTRASFLGTQLRMTWRLNFPPSCADIFTSGRIYSLCICTEKFAILSVHSRRLKILRHLLYFFKNKIVNN